MGKSGYPLPGSDYPPLPSPTTSTQRVGSKYDPYVEYTRIDTSWSRPRTAKAYFREQSGTEKSGTRHVRTYGHYLQSFGAKTEGGSSGWNAFFRQAVPWASGLLTSAAVGGMVHHVMWRPTGPLGRLTWFERVLGSEYILPKVLAAWGAFGAATWGVGHLLQFGPPGVAAWGRGFSFGGRLGAGIRLAADIWNIAGATVAHYVAQFNRNLRAYGTSWRGVAGGSVGPVFHGSGNVTFRPFPMYY